MRLTVLVNPQTRTATFREVSFLAAGDECELLLHGVAGADTASLALVLYRDATLESPVAAVPAGSFSDVPNHRDDRAAALSLSAPEMEAWFLSAALRAQESESSESGNAGAAAESAVRALGWLVVSDASRTWIAMRVPVLLRSFTASGSPVDGSTVAASVMAAVREALAGKADAVPGKGLSSNDFTDALLARLESVSAGAEPNVQADWAVEASSDDAFIRNRPSIPPAPVQADWGCEDSSDPSFVRRKPDLSGIGARQRPDWLAESSADDGIVHKPDLSGFVRRDSLPRADWAETDPSSPSYVANKPVRAVPDWDESDSADPSFIRNRPDLSGFVRLSSFPQADWSEDDEAKPSYVRNRPRRVRPDWLAAESDAAGILNKPEIPPPQEQADWWETSVGSPSYVRHKPQVDQAVSAASPSANAASSKAVADYVAAAVSGLQAAIPGWRVAYWDAKQDALSAARMARWDAAAYASSASAGPWPMVPAEFSGTSLPVSPSECALAAWPSGASSVSVSVLSAGESSDSSDSSSDSGLPPSRRLLVALDCSAAGGPLSVSWPAGSLPASSDAAPGTVNVWRLDEFAAGRFAVHRLHPPAKEQAQADWEEEDSSDPSFVRNRPYVPPVLSDVDLCASEDMWPEGVPTIGLVAEHLAHRRSLSDLKVYREVPAWTFSLPDSSVSVVAGPYRAPGSGGEDFWALDCEVAGSPVTAVSDPYAYPCSDPPPPVIVFSLGAGIGDVTATAAADMYESAGDELALRSEVAQADWDESSSGGPAFIRNKPTIPAPVSVDATLAVQGAAADAKAVGDALRGGFTEWEFDGLAPLVADSFTHANGVWSLVAHDSVGTYTFYGEGTADATSVTVMAGSEPICIATRHLITPTKTSQLTNDGDGTNAFVKTNDTRLSDARTPTAHHATHAANGSDPIAPADIGAAAASDLPYALVTKTPVSGTVALSDRAVNAVSVSSDAVLQLPAAVPGKARDLVIRTAVTGTPAISISSTDASGQSVTMLDTPSFFDGAIFGVTEVAPGTFSVTDPNPPRQVQSNWNETDQDSPAFIQNKPAIPTVPTAYTSVPPMDSANGSAGDSAQWAKGNHSHPTDSSRAPLASPAFTGTPTAPTATGGTNTTQIATTAFVQGAVSGRAGKVSGATAGNLASLDASGNLADSGAKASDFAARADLPYRLVEPGKWEFSGLPEGATGADMSYYDGYWTLYIDYDGETDSTTAQGSENDLVVVFSDHGITATRASLPGHLCDRAGNLVEVSGDTTLTLPAAVPGYLRDFLVRLEISGSTVPTITFAAPTGETLTYETDGDDFPVPDEAGDWLYSFTESCVAHKFSVSLKKVNTVAQGGS